ncbi:NAD kinase [Mesobacillus boroniphilus]|uniref:NAD kinase n=1 Tax=Mesobacillus boroniphilus TaxID=308892 RepID=A0A944GX11_9BACI|nr:NAD kinase [Mesobacillus boroniphilus]MBS8265224.1 NAD kinase [Mesobacillus boroniphilus]
MPDRRNIYFHHKPDTTMLEKVEPIYELARRYDFNIVNDHRTANIIVSIGDDGTFLQAVRKTGFRDDCLYAGISVTGSLNMYCDFHLEDTDKMIEAITTAQIEVRRYPTIEVTIDGDTTFGCLNEFSVRSAIIKAFVMDVFIDDKHFETFRGDGMIVATPTGSTAYNKSVNGAVVDPLLPCMQVSELASVNNNHYRTLGSSFILSGDRKLTFKVAQDGNDYPIMGMDNEALSIQHVEKFDVKLSNKIIKTVKLKDNSFWEKVKRTFL